MKNYTIQNEKAFDNLKWEDASINEFVGCTIIGAEPLVDGLVEESNMVGVILYAENQIGQKMAFEIKTEQEFNEVFLSKAEIHET